MTPDCGAGGGPERPRRPTAVWPLAIGAMLIFSDAEAIGTVNDSYETIRAASGIGTVIGLGLAALVLPLLGVVFLVNGLTRRR